MKLYSLQLPLKRRKQMEGIRGKGAIGSCVRDGKKTRKSEPSHSLERAELSLWVGREIVT